MKRTLIALSTTLLLAACGHSKKPMSEQERLQSLGYQSDVSSSSEVNH